MKKRVLFLVNGLGLGNSTRCHAVIQHLAAEGADVAVMTSGNGAWYFRGRRDVVEVHELEPLYYGVGGDGLSILKTLIFAIDLYKVVRRNAAATRAMVEKWAPDIVLADSVYGVGGIRRRGVPLVAVNNSDVIHSAYRRLPNPPTSTRAQFYLIEEMDYLFHRLIPDLVLSPSLEPNAKAPIGNFRTIGPIVRPEVLIGREGTAGRSGDDLRVLVMLSGSQFGSRVRLDPDRHDYRIDVVGREAQASQEPSDSIAFHGKLSGNENLVRRADVMVVNGGFSAVSEAFVLRKPMVVIPVPNHAEQWVNAKTIENLGVGMIADDASLEDALCEAVARIDGFAAAYAELPPPEDGARQAAAAILELTE